MPRRERTTADIQDRLGRTGPVRSRSRRSPDWCNGLDRRELIAAVCNHFCQGQPMGRIRELIRTELGVELKREDPWQIVSFAAAEGWLRYQAPHEARLREQIRRSYDWLQGVEVVHTASIEDVAYRGAEMLLDLIRLHHRAPYSRQEVHIGFAGGGAMRRLARYTAEILGRTTGGLPETLVLHAIVAGFNVEDPTFDPNAFFTYFANDPMMPVKTRFVGLHAPAIVRQAEIAGLRALQGIQQAYHSADQLDILVTSASSWSDEHSMLMAYMKKSPESYNRLRDAGCVGDLMWRPVGPHGPLTGERKNDIRAMTLLELSDLAPFISHKGKHVLLLLGPCGTCNMAKGELLRCILDLRPSLLSHLVVDSRSARELLQGGGGVAGAGD
jgi:DNA-binding transcriptional regulator LsrR (DeoR family)